MNRFVRIECDDGTSHGLRVTDVESGAQINGLTEIAISAKVNDLVTATLDVFCTEVSCVAGAEVRVIDPATGDLKSVNRIEFEDGTVWPSK